MARQQFKFITRNGKRFRVPIEPKPTPEISPTIAKPVEAQKAISEAAEAGAFTIQTPAKQTVAEQISSFQRKLAPQEPTEEAPKPFVSTAGTEAIQEFISGGFDPTTAARLAREQGKATQQEVNAFLNEQSRIKREQEITTGTTFATGGETDLEAEARARIAGERVTRAELAKELGLSEDTVLSTLQEELDRRFEQQKRDRERQARIFGRQEQIEQSEFAASERRGTAATSSAISQFAQGREQPVSTATPMVAQQFASEVRENTNRSRLRLANAQDRRQALGEQLQEAQRAGNENLIESLSGRIANVQQQIRNEQIQVANSAAAATKQAFDFLEQAPAGSLTDLSIAEISSGLGIDPSQAAFLKQLDTQKLEARATDPDFLIKQAELAKTISEARVAGLTTAQRNFLTLQDIKDPADKALFEQLINLNPNLTTFKSGDDTYSFNPATGETNRIVNTSDSNNVIPTGQLVTVEAAGRPVTLDSAAMVGFLAANQSLREAGLGELKIGGADTSSTRNQAQTIATVAERFGIGFNAANPNETAQVLRDMGFAIANVGGSKHEQGLAIDIFPNNNYINQVKPILEANGWKQTIPNGDAGHFEFVGISSPISIEAKNLSKQIDRNELEFDQIKDSKLQLEVAAIRAGLPLSKEEKQKPFTDSQSNSWIFTNRMKIAGDIINQFDDQFFKVGSKNPLNLIGVIPFIDTPNFLRSSDQQVVDQAERNFLNAVLRRESGAAISPDEFDSGSKQYFRRAGDSAAVIEQKRQNRIASTSLMLDGSGKTAFKDGTDGKAFGATVFAQPTLDAETAPTLSAFTAPDGTPFLELDDINSIIDNTQ